MTTFWIGIAALTLLALALIWLPFLRRSRAAAQASDAQLRKETNLNLFNERLAEIDTELAEQRISQDEYDALKQELQMSLLQNVVLPMEFLGADTPKERHDRAMHLLETVGLADQAGKLPGMVSGGQQQRAAIARALANDPPLLVADEPTGNLDSKTAEQVFDIFRGLVEDEGKTLLMVTHDPHLADLIPRQINIVNGRIADDSRRGPAISLPLPSSHAVPVLGGVNGKLSPVVAA